MEQIRRNVFETNSSSTHSITICSKDEFQKWKNGELFYYECNNEFVDADRRNEIIRKWILEDKINTNWKEKTITFKGETVSFEGYNDREEKIKKFYTTENLSEITQEEIDEFLEEEFDIYETPCSYDEYFENIRYETYETKHTTAKGEEIIAFGYYGYDG